MQTREAVVEPEDRVEGHWATGTYAPRAGSGRLVRRGQAGCLGCL